MAAQRPKSETTGEMARALWEAHAALQLDADGVVTSVSEPFRATGVDGAVGKPLRSLVVPSDVPALDRLWNDLRDGRPGVATLRFPRTSDQRACWLHLSFTPLPGPSKRFIALGTDVTATHRDLDDAESQLRALRASKAVIEFDLSGHIRTANQNFLDAVGYEMEEIRGQHHRLFVLPEERETEAYRSFWDRLAAGESFNAQYQRVRKDGRRIWIEASYCAVKTPDGRPYKIVKFCSDITELVEAFMALQQAAHDIGTASSQIAGSSDQVEVSVKDTQHDIESVAVSARDVVERANSVAQGLDQLRLAVREVSSNAAEAAGVAREAVATARNSDAQMRRLGASSEEIGGILKTIASIAEQTNLLALNATIEAARAGEAGKGFAVVATEVKELAKQTANATDDIGRKVEAIRSGTSSAMQATVHILDTIQAIDSAQSSIASAVDMQTETVQDIGKSIEQARKGIATISERADSATSRAITTASRATEASSAANDLELLAEQLRRLAHAADPRRDQAVESPPEPHRAKNEQRPADRPSQPRPNHRPAARP
jgi:methyl-accepting chemotaxis protein